MLGTRNTISSPGLKTKSSTIMQSTGMLTLSEYKGMKERVKMDGVTEEQEKRQKEMQELKEKCDTRVKSWPNTIDALRKKKDEARYERFEKEEAERRRIDIIEAQIQETIRQSIIGKANTQVYETNDRVKAFQSALKLSDALKEREAQVAILNRKKEMDKMIAAHYYDLEQEQMLAYDEKEVEKAKLQEAKRVANHKVVKDQHDQFVMKHIKKIQEAKIEGELVKIKAQEALEKEKVEEMMRKQKVLEAQEATKKGNEQLQEIRRQEKLKELAQDREIETFAKKKEEIMEMRRIREDLKFKEKQDSRQRIIDAQIEKLKQIKNKEDEILNKQVKEAEIKAEEVERIKREKREQLVEEIDKQIAFTLERKKAEKEREVVEEKNFQNFWNVKNKEIEEKETKDKIAQKERAKDLQQYHLKQIDHKTKAMEQNIIKEFDDALKMKAGIQEEEKVFQSYAAKCLAEWDGAGKNLQPLLLELNNYKKKIR